MPSLAVVWYSSQLVSPRNRKVFSTTMINPVRIALVSYQVKSDKEANIQVLADVLSTFEDSGIQMFVLPELSISGSYSSTKQDYLELAESVPDGPSALQVAALARQYQTVICAGILEKSKERYFITHFLCGPLGYIGKQRKLFSQNPLTGGLLSAGQKLFVHHLFGHRCVILACADWLLPEGSYLAGVNEAALIISPTDGMALSQENTLRGIALARAIDTRAHLVAAIGGDTPRDGEAVMAGLVAAPAALGTSELLVCETRKLEEVKVMCADLPLQQPQLPWGGLHRRTQAFLALCAAGTSEQSE